MRLVTWDEPEVSAEPDFNRRVFSANKQELKMQSDDEDTATSETQWPVEVDLILSAMEAGRRNAIWTDRRKSSRQSLRLCADLHLFADGPGEPPTAIYTRDVTPRGMGFITQDRLPLGYGGTVEFTLPDGKLVRAQCTIYRCREAVNGWFEGALNFTREQADLC